MKQNAKEYLKEFAHTQSNWLKSLIYEVIETNGNISSDKKNEIFNSLKNDKLLTIKEPNINDDNSDKEIYITLLEHIRGVNALKENQIIKFHNDVTILYGLNGAGKSSYFKILNEIVGGNQKKEILSNIYLDTPQSIDVKISFQEKTGQVHTTNWDGSNRSLDLLNKCKVFDFSYLNGLLEIRKADSTLIQPLGLNLFSYLVSLVDEFKQRLSDDTNRKRLEKPILELEYFKDEIKKLFENHKVTEKIKTQIEDLFIFTTENSQKLKATKKELEDLKQINIQDKIKLKNNDKRDIDSIKTNLETLHKELSTLYINAKKELELLIKNKEASNLAKKQFEVLSTIPNSDNSEWKDFIKTADKYQQKVDDGDKVCIYCRQPLQNENTIALVKAYGEFLRDESEQKLNNSIRQINDLKVKIEAISSDLLIKDNIQKILENYKMESTEKTLFETITTINTELLLGKIKILENLDKENIDFDFNLSDIANISMKLNSISSNIQEDINKLSDDDTKKGIEIDRLDKTLKELQENESISNQQVNIKKWFEIDLEEKNLRDKVSKVNTTSITALSKKAHDSLLTENLKKVFKEELSFLGYQNLDVKIETAKGEKGTSSTKLILSKNNDVKTILSEGEQKAVALALFITEAKIQKSKNPIIMDDPVNSLDHKIAGKFAKRLLELDNQVILFNHNRLFLDAFETSKTNHICKNFDGGCNSNGKHIRIYQVNNEGLNAKGVLSNYKSNKARIHIKEANSLLNKSPFENEVKVATLLRKTVECVIDEVVFNNQLPTKYSNKNSRIAWNELKKLKNDSSTIDTLETIHGRVSGGAMHNGTESEENPIEVDEFKMMISSIESILGISQ